MPAIVLELLKYVFLAVLYIFVGRAIRAIYLELRVDAPKSKRQGKAAPARPQNRKPGKAPRKVAIVEGDQLKGKSFELGSELVIGRADKCHIKLDDTYVSQIHARVFQKDGNFMVEDMGSTNGTYLNRTRVTGPTEVQRGDRIKIGKTVMELRK